MIKGSSKGLALALTLGVLSSGCASIMSGNKQTMSFQSTPEGVTVSVNGRVLGKTPVSISMEKKKDQTVIFSRDGFKPVTMQLTTQLDAWFWGNIVFGGPIGSTVDAINGSVHMYSPSQYYVTLQPDVKGADGKTSLSPEHRIKDFVVFNYGRIVGELSADKVNGENTTSLLRLLSVDAADSNKARVRLADLSTQNPDAVDFASAVVADFGVSRH
jgi:hypothetical protein